MGIERHVVGEEPRAHRRIHRIRHGQTAEQERPAGRRQAIAPDGEDALDIGLRARPHLELRVEGLEVHRQRRAQVVEARVHLAADGPAPGPLCGIGRQQSGLREGLGQVLGDGHGVPHFDSVVGEHRHQERGREQQEFGPRRGVIHGNPLLVHVEAGELAQQMSPQAPRRIILAADGQDGRCHRGKPQIWCESCSSCPGAGRLHVVRCMDRRRRIRPCAAMQASFHRLLVCHTIYYAGHSGPLPET